MKRVLPAALVVVIAVGVSGMGRASGEAACGGRMTLGGWSQETTGCTFVPAGTQLTVLGVGATSGVAMARMVPLPPIINLSVSIEAPDGTTLLTCSSIGNAATQCSRTGQASYAGTALRCVVRGWSNLSQGSAAIEYGCAGL